MLATYFIVAAMAFSATSASPTPSPTSKDKGKSGMMGNNGKAQTVEYGSPEYQKMLFGETKPPRNVGKVRLKQVVERNHDNNGSRGMIGGSTHYTVVKKKD